MQLHCLGTAGYHPNEDRHTSCYFLPESGIVLDAGTGLFRLAELIETPTLDIVLSHAHLDHVAGLTFLLDVLYQRPVDRLRIWGEKEKLAAIEQHLFSNRRVARIHDRRLHDPLATPTAPGNVRGLSTGLARRDAAVVSDRHDGGRQPGCDGVERGGGPVDARVLFFRRQLGVGE